ncbi:MAG: ATP synthase F1 subunit delta [Phycisphaerales bacterium]|nr:ATP synthase F1 subunit delta [Phycisphaerales bacterium]
MSTHTDALAMVYARSLYELAEQAGGQPKIEEIADELEQIAELMRSDAALREFFASPIIDVHRRTETIRRIFSDRVTDLTLRFLLVLNDKGRLFHFSAIQGAFDRIVQETFGRVEVDVFTPAAMDDGALAALRDRIRASIGKEPVLHPYVDATMLGGLKLRIGDRLIDGSLATRLRRIRARLLGSASGAVSGRLDGFITTD